MKTAIVTLPYDTKWRAHLWAKEYCKSYIDYSVRIKAPMVVEYVEYYFKREADATLFRLRWL